MSPERKKEIAMRYADLIQQGLSPSHAAIRVGVSMRTCERLLVSFRSGPQGLADAPRSGRPAQVTLTEQDAQLLRAEYIRINRTKKKGSKTLAARRLAKQGRLSSEVAQAILKPRASKHQLPAPVARAMEVSETIIQHHRAPRKAAWTMGHAPGVLRKHWEENRRLYAGERESWDDGTINFPVAVPWPYGGDKCSDRWGYKVSRFELLLSHDDATSYCPGFTFVCRSTGAYRAIDIVSACGRQWRDTIRPDHVYFERGAWESHRAKEFLAATGVHCDRAYAPRQKLVENYFNRLWSVLSTEQGQVGRYRGENEEQGKLLTRCQSGSTNPLDHFLPLDKAIGALQNAVAYLNSEPIESKQYGTWIPEDRYHADLAQRPKQPLASSLAWSWAPERRIWTVRGGLVGGMVQTPLGMSIPYHFACPELLEYTGRKVRVYFDPCEDPIRATITLAEDWRQRGLSAGHLISGIATCLTDAPIARSTLKDIDMHLGGMEAIHRAASIRKKYAAAVRTEYRALGLAGKVKAWSSTQDDGLGDRTSAEVSPVRRAAAAETKQTTRRETTPTTHNRAPQRDRMMEHLGIKI
ncbi:MAG: hypothetical protein JJT75_15030 [Opitutales bacterium]|nr:hypothetical protein [Opitutales bacterium]